MAETMEMAHLQDWIERLRGIRSQLLKTAAITMRDTEGPAANQAVGEMNDLDEDIERLLLDMGGSYDRDAR